jgi:hypothetical protein
MAELSRKRNAEISDMDVDVDLRTKPSHAPRVASGYNPHSSNPRFENEITFGQAGLILQQIVNQFNVQYPPPYMTEEQWNQKFFGVPYPTGQRIPIPMSEQIFRVYNKKIKIPTEATMKEMAEILAWHPDQLQMVKQAFDKYGRFQTWLDAYKKHGKKRLNIFWVIIYSRLHGTKPMSWIN